jgi:Xaa-Pro aminopeptidase
VKAKNYSNRIAALRAQLVAENLDAMVISHLPHVRYLTGYSGSNGLVFVTDREAWFFTDFRYIEQAKKEVKRAKIVTEERDIWKNLPNIKSATIPRIKIGFQSAYLTQAQYGQLRHLLPKSLAVGTMDILENLTAVKDAEEIDAIKKAVKISDRGFEKVLDVIKPGVREIDVAAELEYIMKRAGSEKPAFDTIVASGWRAALPHGIASTKKIAEGDFVTLDFGATYKGYVSDITRTVVVGKPTDRQKKVYNLVKKAQKAAVIRIKAGMTGIKADSLARKVIERAGHGKKFGHGLGHGIGLYVHEYPRLGTQSPDVLQRNMVVTVEPGVYFPGWGGVRIEDDVVVTTNGVKILNEAERTLISV